MSYSIQVGQFAKRINSTKRPTSTDLAAFVEYQNVFLKSAPTEYNNPVVRLETEFASFAPNNYNYAVMFGRWYWITNVIAIRTNLIELHLSLDVLAKARGAILDTKAFIEYGFNTTDAGDASTRIRDQRRPVSQNPSAYTAQADITGGALSATGCYILQCVSELWGVACYALDDTAMHGLCLNVATDLDADLDQITAGTDPADIAKNIMVLVDLVSEGYKNSLLAESAISAIKSIHWLPINHASVPGITGSRIYLGSYDTNVFGTRLNYNALWTHSGSINIPWPVNDWRRNYCQISLYVPFFGTVPVPVDQCINNGSVTFTLSLDILGGDLTIRITSGSQTIYTGATNVAAPYAFGTSTISASRALSGMIQTMGGALQIGTGIVDIGAGIVGAAFGNPSGGSIGAFSVISGAQAAASGYAQAIQPLITSAGSMGGISALGQNTNAIITLLYYAPIADSDFEAIYGHPVFKVDKPAAGFCKTRGFSLSLGLEPQYISLINSAMDGGVFVE